MPLNELLGSMKSTVYLETTVISYLTAWPSRDVVVLGQQQQTREWWDTRGQQFDLYCSELVVQEASAGDSNAAAARLAALAPIPRLVAPPDAAVLASSLTDALRLPTRAQADAMHVAIAAMNGMDYLLTWNCRHLNNAIFRPRIEDVCRDHGFEPPLICTPGELMETLP